MAMAMWMSPPGSPGETLARKRPNERVLSPFFSAADSKAWKDESLLRQQALNSVKLKSFESAKVVPFKVLVGTGPNFKHEQ